MPGPPPAPPVCFVKGTLILTPAGERMIEDLEVGDLITTFEGEHKPIRWIGRRTFSSLEGNWPSRFVPVRIKRGALGPDLPRRDLYVSPGHMLFVDGVLVPAKFLTNGKTIVPAIPDAGATVEYFHIELSDHDLLVSEGIATGSLRAGPSKRERFGNFAEYARLYPHDSRGKPAPYAKIVPSKAHRLLFEATGILLNCKKIEAIRERISRRAAEPVD